MQSGDDRAQCCGLCTGLMTECAQVAEQLQSMGINISAEKLEALHNMGYTPEKIIASLGHKACVEEEGPEDQNTAIDRC